MYDDLHFHYITPTPTHTHTHTHSHTHTLTHSHTGSWTQALKRVLESVYSYFSYDVNTYIASSLSRSPPPATEAAVTVNESSEDTPIHCGGSSLPQALESNSGTNRRHFHHGSSSSSEDSTIARSSSERTAANCASPSLEDSRSDQSSSSSRKQPNKSISSFTVENILMGRQRSSSSSDSPTTTMSGSFSATPPPSSSCSSSLSTVSGGSSSSNHSSVVGTNWVSHPPVKYTKFTMLSPTSMADETQKKKKTDSMIEVQWRDSSGQETAQGGLSASIDQSRELKRVPSGLRGSMDLSTSFPITQKPKSFSRSSSSGTPSSYFHKINASSSNSQPQQQSFLTQNILQNATKVSTLPVVQAVPTAPDAKAAVLHQTFPPSGQQVVLLIPSNSTTIAGNVPTIFYANPVLSLSQSGTTTASPAGVAKLTAVAPISTATATQNSTSSSVTQKNDLGRVSPPPPSSLHKRHTAIDEAAHNQLSESPHRPIAPKLTTTTTQITATPSAASAPESDCKNGDKMKLYLKRTIPKPPKLRFHMTTVMKQPTGNTVMTSLTAQSPQAIIGEAAGAEHGSLAAAAATVSEFENEKHLRSEVAVESTITRSPNVYSNEGTPLHKQPVQRVIATATAPWTTTITTKQEPDSNESSPTQQHSPQTNGAVKSTTATGSSANNSTTTTTTSCKNGTIDNKKPQTAVLKDSGFHLQLVKQQSGGTSDMNTNGPTQPQLQNTAKEQETGSSGHSAVQKTGRQNGRQSGPGRGRGRATRSYTRRKRELTFHLYEDPSTAFRAKRQCRDKE